ncbi:hypothetical protein OF83DRAFT_1087254 [Amylostereum chailletii]|nr:hypothetical protein OF83DRAFT_1087254 [Amylostereum chailletii]
MASLAIFLGQCFGGESCTADSCMVFFEDPDHPGQCWCGHSSTAHELSANPCPTDGNSHFHTLFSSPTPSVIPLPPNPPGAVFHASVPMPSAQAQPWYAPANAAPGPSQPPLGVSPSPLGAIAPTTGLYIPRAPAPQGNPFTSRQSSSSNSRPPRRSSAPVSQLPQFVFEVVFRTEGMPGTCGYSESEAYGFSPTKLHVPPENYHHAYVLRAKELGVGFTWSVSAHNNDLILPSFKPAVEWHMSENGFTPDHASDFDFLECNQRARVGSTTPALFHPVDVNRVTFQKLKSLSSKYSRLAGVPGGTTPYLVIFILAELRMGVLQGKLRGHGFHACYEPRLQHGFRWLDIEFAQEQPASEGVGAADSPDSPRCWAICVENDVSSSSMPPLASASSSLSLPHTPAPLLPLAGPSIQPATEAVDVEMADTTSLTISSPTVLSPAIPSPPTPIPTIWQDRQELSTAKVPPVLKAWLQRQTAAHETVSCRIYIQGPDEESIAKGLLQYIRARVQSLEEDPPLPEGVEIDGCGLPGHTSLGEGVARIVWGHVWQLLLDEGNALGPPSSKPVPRQTSPDILGDRRPVACADEVISQLKFHRIAHNLEDDVNVSQISDLDYTALQDRYTAAIIRWLYGGNGVERVECFLETTTGLKLLLLPMHIIKVNFDVYVGENVGVSAHTCFRTLDVLINGETAAYINTEIPESPYPVTLFDSFWDSCMVPTGLNAL